jgi:hypothetical protein
MSCPHPIPDGAGYAETKTFVLGLFFVARLQKGAPLEMAAVPGEDPPPKIQIDKEKSKLMKKLSVVVAGTGQIRDVDIQPGTTAGDVLHQLTLPDYLLSKGPNDPFFAAAESIYDKVKDGEKVFASTKAEVGVLAQCA